MILDEHLDYLADRVRCERFQQAIEQVVGPGDRVLDLGCGSGILGLLSLQAGAGSVVAIDSSAMIEVARETFARAGYAAATHCIRAHSQRVELPGLVDLVIADHVGCFGLDYGILHTLQDARLRFLKPGGRLLPARIVLQLAAIESRTARDKAEAWQSASIPAEFHWLRRHSINQRHGLRLPASAVLGSPVQLADIDLCADQAEFFSWTIRLNIERDGILHGLAGWFDCELARGVWMTNSPLADAAIGRPQAFLPIDEATPLSAGDVVTATIMMRPAEHLMAWVVEIPSQGKRFSHSTWQGMVLADDDVLRARPDRVPKLSRAGRARLTVLDYCDGQRSAIEIKQAVLRDHPQLLPSLDETARFVDEVIGRDTE
jgi:protein arginine N-methyltransferase 1